MTKDSVTSCQRGDTYERTEKVENGGGSVKKNLKVTRIYLTRLTIKFIKVITDKEKDII